MPFAVTKTDLPPNALPSLDKLADRMKTNEDIRIQLMGFANGNSGSASQARRSSLFRALSVRNYLMKQGVRTTRMDVRALGQTSVKGVSPDRVDIVVQP
ncbi:MAG: OmpA family protein [Pseudomonadota bacterium]|nr:OmpA family protein [Pseudomonadota bacterium]